MPTALITGISGQDGSYLCDLLLEKGYEVHGLYRHSSCDNLWRIRNKLDKITLHKGDITDPASLYNAIWQATKTGVNELYHVADQDNVGWSMCGPVSQVDVTYKSVQNILETVRSINSRTRVFLPSSATIFGMCPPTQSEQSTLDPQSPYACAKAAVLHLARYYRRQYGLHVSVGIMFNHDSPRRADGYLLQKICRAAINIRRRQQKELVLGDLNMKVDIGYAKEYMEAAIAMLQQGQPDDYIIATGVNGTITIREMVEIAFYKVGIDLAAIPELVKFDSSINQREQPRLIGDYSKAKTVFGFEPKTNIGQLIHMILETHW